MAAYHTRKIDKPTQYCFNAGPQYMALIHHQNNVYSTPFVCWFRINMIRSIAQLILVIAVSMSMILDRCR